LDVKGEFSKGQAPRESLCLKKAKTLSVIPHLFLDFIHWNSQWVIRRKPWRSWHVSNAFMFL